MKNMWFQLAMLLVVSMTVLSCNEQQSDTDSETTVVAADEQQVEVADGNLDIMPYGPRYLSMIDFKGLYNRSPSALDIGRAGNYMFFKLLLTGGQHAVFSVSLSGGKAGEPVELLRGEEYNIAYIAAHPTGNECLLTTNYKAEDGHIHNRIWRVGPGLLEEISYEGSDGYPADHPPAAMTDLKPYYSWDGEQVIVPLTYISTESFYMATAVMDADGSTGKWIDFPDPRIQVTGAQSGVLPDSGMGRLIYFNVWEARDRNEKCRIFTLDLDNPQEFELQTDATWVVYRFSSPDLEYEPWVLHGSRLPDYLEAKRQIRMVQYDPESTQVRDMEIGGDPEFNLQMDAYASHFAYFDRVRQSLIRLDLESGEELTDDRWYSPESRIFITEDGEEVYVWERDILMQAFEN